MRRWAAVFIGVVGLLAVSLLVSQRAWAGDGQTPQTQLGREGCLSCHEGIEDIRPQDSDMMRQLKAMGECTACHGGDPTVTGTPDDEEAVQQAHSGEFYPDPGNIWIADRTCGKCHPGYAESLRKSLMNTEAGKIHGTLWAFGAFGGKYGLDPERIHKVIYGNYDVKDEDGPTPIFGTEMYKKYMEALVQAFPDQFPQELKALPLPSVEEIVENPEWAAFTYLRSDCQRCHVGVPPRAKRGDWRGTGCSACHMPYSNEGYYEGNDPTIPKDEPGHILVHTIQATRESPVKVGDKVYTGIPVETCNSCHNRGKRIGVSYEGLMEFPYGTPFDPQGGKQPKLHTKVYLFIQDDVHHSGKDGKPGGGMLCQDCHTSIDMHGDGNIFGTTLAQVEIECADCHGTPDKYPWELPLGFQEEELGKAAGLKFDEPRGLWTKNLPRWMTYGTVYDMKDGYLLTARGNPFGNVVKDGDKVILYSATGKEFEVPLLKKIKEEGSWVSKDSEVAMDKVKAHMEKMECYACHASWAPQCYGCHVVVDYREGKTSTDWLATAQKYIDTQGRGKHLDFSKNPEKQPGKASEGRAYLRWEDPILGINGEGRVTPIIPGCQVVYTVIGPDGTTLVHNKIGRTPPNTEGAGAEGQRGIDMAPAQPHTVGLKARRCESCHDSEKALGYGIQGGIFLQGYDEPRYVDLLDGDGNVVPQKVQIQMQPIPDLPFDWSQVINPETGEQQMTVGQHWPASRPLDKDIRDRMERIGVCMGCHQNMTDPAFWTDQVVATYGKVVTNEEHIQLMNQLIHDAVQGKAAQEQVKKLQKQVEQLKKQQEAQPAKPAATPAEVPVQPPQGVPVGYAIGALVLGILLGIGAMALRKSDE